MTHVLWDKGAWKPIFLLRMLTPASADQGSRPRGLPGPQTLSGTLPEPQKNNGSHVSGDSNLLYSLIKCFGFVELVNFEHDIFVRDVVRCMLVN